MQIINPYSFGGAAYNPAMMDYAGAGYYSKSSLTISGNAYTAVFRFNTTSFTGGGVRYLGYLFDGTQPVFSALVYSSDHATTAYRNKALIYGKNSSNVACILLLSNIIVTDGVDRTLWITYDATAGTAGFYLNGSDCDDTGEGSRILNTATLGSGSGCTFYVGSGNVGNNKFTGQIGYCGIRMASLSNPTDFHDPSNGLQELDESGWTEWGAQPLFWNQYGTMSANVGSAGNMTANGTITGPS